MGLPLAKKILQSHLAEGKMEPGEEIGIKVDQVLTQDATGTMAFLQFEAIGLDRIKVPLAVSYVDHNMLQTDFMNPDDHKYLETVAAKYGAYFSKPGNGICHQVHLERFSQPGKILIGSDSHTPTSGGAGMLAIGVGGLSIATVMGGEPCYVAMPEIVGVKLTGRLKPWVTAKDIILEMLRRLTVKGGLNRIIEYYGEGVETLSVPQRSTITNMGAEMGATTSIFPSDEVTKSYFQWQQREKDWQPAQADTDAVYDKNMEINLSELEPMIVKPGSPDNVVPVKEVEGTETQQVIIGSCTNSSYTDLMAAVSILKGRKIHSRVTFGVNPGSRQVLMNVARAGALEVFTLAGARINESACLGCIGMGQAPGTDWVSVRSFNRNWPGRSGNANDKVYLTSPEVCVATAIHGEITDPRKLGAYPHISLPKELLIDDSMILPPAANGNDVQIIRGPNIKPLPRKDPLEPGIAAEILIKVGDNISTDAIMPAGSKVLPLRSNVPAISEFVFSRIDTQFVERAKKAKEHGGGIIVGGSNYGQGSSREHAALAPMYLGVKAVLVKSFARIHFDNLINFGILPLTFKNPEDYEKIRQGEKLVLEGVRDALANGNAVLHAKVNGHTIPLEHRLTERQRQLILDGGLLNYIKIKNN